MPWGSLKVVDEYVMLSVLTNEWQDMTMIRRKLHRTGYQFYTASWLLDELVDKGLVKIRREPILGTSLCKEFYRR